ncbi:MAG: hypothetical protein R3255_10435, partial [Candidatus Lokiarchaeia archaeon]|nr:hypothetical protein [Candidatus Lokiarchaeia archaeon]
NSNVKYPYVSSDEIFEKENIVCSVSFSGVATAPSPLMIKTPITNIGINFFIFNPIFIII